MYYKYSTLGKGKNYKYKENVAQSEAKQKIYGKYLCICVCRITNRCWSLAATGSIVGYESRKFVTFVYLTVGIALRNSNFATTILQYLLVVFHQVNI